MQFKFKSYVFLLLLQFFIFVTGERVRDMIYAPIAGASCFRRLNGTHQIGCSSAYSGSVGVLHHIQIQGDIEYLLRSPPAPPYAPIIPPHLFTRENLLRLKNEGARNISVVLLINRPDKMTQFSHELTCPNMYSGILQSNSLETLTCNSSNPTSTWNPWGSGLLHEDFPFPIYYIEDVDEIDKLVDCFEKFNNFAYSSHSQRSLCAVEVETFMSAAVNSEVCIRRTNIINSLGRTKYCDPLEGRNIYATLFPRNIIQEQDSQEDREMNETERFVLVTTRLDTTSMFDGVGLGVLDSLLSYVTLLNVGHMLSQLLSGAKVTSGLNVLFMVFNGESYDYIGSQRFVYDLEQSAFPMPSTHTAPISLKNIELMVDIGVLDDLPNIKVHTVNEFPKARTFLELLQKYGNVAKYDFKMDFQSAVGLHLPPTSAQSFLRKNITFPALVLNTPPTNKYYHSIYDNEVNVNFTYANTSLDYTGLMEVSEAADYFPADAVQMKIRNISSVIALALYEVLTGHTYADTKLVNPLLVDEIFHCFLQSADCPLFDAISPPNSPRNSPIPPSRYISVGRGSQEVSGWTYRLLGYLLSQQQNVTQDKCNNQTLHWVAGFDGNGECRLTTQSYSQALSPAFIIDDYNWQSGEYSTWTESTWSQLSARIFLRPSKLHEAVILSIGIVVLIISFCLVYIVSSKGDVLFVDVASTTAA